MARKGKSFQSFASKKRESRNTCLQAVPRYLSVRGKTDNTLRTHTHTHTQEVGMFMLLLAFCMCSLIAFTCGLVLPKKKKKQGNQAP